MRRCSVAGCKSFKKPRRPALFKVQIKNKLKWTAIVKKVTNQTKPLNYVCYEHFSPDDVKTTMALPKDITLVSMKYTIHLYCCHKIKV